MRQKHKRDTALHSLANEFESMSKRGNSAYFEDRHLFQLIGYYENEYSPEKAMEVTDYALKQYKYRVDFYIIKIRLLMQFGEYESALDLITQAENISPMEWDLKLMKCRIYARLKDFSGALAYINELKELNMGQQDFLDLLLEEAYVYEQMKQFDKMYDVLRNILLSKPDHPEALEHIWMSVEICKNYRESIALHQVLIESNPYIYQAWYNLGHAYSCLGEYEKAIQSLEYSFIINPEFEFGYKDCADLCFQIKNYDQALEVYLEYLDRFGPESEVMVSIGHCYQEIGDYFQARHFLKKANRLDPYNDEVHYCLGICDLRQGKFDQAVKNFQKAIRIEDRREEYFAHLAEAYVNLGDLDKADFYFRKATETGPEQSEYWYKHVQFLLTIEEPQMGLEVLDEAEYYTCGMELMYCRAACLLLSDSKEEGLLVLHDALSDYPEGSYLIYELVPSFRKDSEISAIINYLSGE
ncbi:MAG: tetratricopeptide repeat protein [Saprospirales bacterium]|nr:MAG: tetratricopeptide repeat protein [Saprospirales bacterium]